jgi:hypothetical protein
MVLPGDFWNPGDDALRRHSFDAALRQTQSSGQQHDPTQVIVQVSRAADQ